MHSLVPAAELVDHSIVDPVEHAVADKAMLTRCSAGCQRRDARHRRGREDPLDHRRFRQTRCEKARVARAERAHAQPVGQYHDGLGHRGEPENVGLAAECGEGTCQNIGKAQGSELAGR